MGIAKRMLEDIQEEEFQENISQWVYDKYDIEDFDQGHPDWEDYKKNISKSISLTMIMTIGWKSLRLNGAV